MRGAPVQVNRALIRPILFCGVEGRIAILYGIICFALLLTTRFHFPAAFIPIGLFFILHMFFVWIAKQDPMMVVIYNRHIRYRQKYFPPRGGVNSHIEVVRPSVYTGVM